MRLLARRGQHAGKGYSARWQGVVSKLAKATQQIRNEWATKRIYYCRFFTMRNLSYLLKKDFIVVSHKNIYTPSTLYLNYRNNTPTTVDLMLLLTKQSVILVIN